MWVSCWTFIYTYILKQNGSFKLVMFVSKQCIFSCFCSVYKVRITPKSQTFTSTDHRGYKLWSCQNVCNALSYLLDNVYIIFSNKYSDKLLVLRLVQIVLLLSSCTPIGTNCAPLVADLFLFIFFICYERDFTTSLFCDNEADIIEAFN